MSAYLPSDHDGLSSDGWALGRGSSMNGVSSILSGVGGVDSGSTSSISPYTDNSWHHVVTTFDGGNRKLYIDSVEVSSLDSSGSITANAHALIFGGTDMNASAAGEDATKSPSVANHSSIKLDEVRIYDTALSNSDITEMFNYGKGDLSKVGGFLMAPSVITGNTGSALSQTVTADFPNALYYAYNLPSGLSINSATGEISGSPAVGGTHILTVTATGGTNQAPKKASTTITYTAPSSSPKYGSPGAANVLTSSALLLAEIEQSGANSNTIDFVWDTSDKGTSNISDWNGSALAVGTGKEGFYGKQVSDLNISTTYYYRNRAVVAKNLLDLAPSSLKLWLDASDFTGGSNWPDKSGNSNDATRSGSPSVQNNAQNGLSVMRYSANGQFHTFSKMTDIRTVFWVLKRTGTDTEQRFLLGDHTRSPDTYHFHPNGQRMYHGSHAHANVRTGTTRVNGSSVNGTSTNYPSTMSVISVKTAGNVTASSFSRDRHYSQRVWKGDLGELIIFNTALSDSEIASIAKSYGAEVPFLRPDNISGDTSSDLDFVLHAINEFKKLNAYPEYIVHIRPTTPLRDPNLIDEAISLFQNNKEFNSLRSVHLMSESSYKTLEINNGTLTPLSLFNKESMDANAPRQSFPDTYQANGYVDILSTDFIMKNHKMHGKKILPFITKPAYEVDTIEDFDYLEYLAANSQGIIKKLFN